MIKMMMSTSRYQYINSIYIKDSGYWQVVSVTRAIKYFKNIKNIYLFQVNIPLATRYIFADPTK